MYLHSQKAVGNVLVRFYAFYYDFDCLFLLLKLFGFLPFRRFWFDFAPHIEAKSGLCIFFLHFISQKRFEPCKGWEGCTKVENKKRDKNKRKRETVLKMKIISFACRIRQWRQYREVYYGNKYDRHFFGSFFRFVGKLTCSIFFSSNTRWHFG